MLKNKIKLTLGSILGIFSCQLFAAGMTINLQTYYPASMTNAEKEFAEAVKEKTKGEIEVKIYSAGELVGTGDILSAVESNTIQMGRAMGHHYTEQVIGNIEGGLPMAWLGIDEAEDIYFEKGLFELVREEYNNHGVEYLGPVWIGPYHILSKRPINSLDDLRKMKIRAVGASGKVLADLGVSVVSMPPEDIYLALTTGQIDGVLYGSPFEFKETKYYEAARFFLETPIVSPITDSLIINKDLWAQLTEEQKNAINEAAERFRYSYYEWLAAEDEKALDELFRNTKTKLSEQDIEEMRASAIKVWETEAVRSKNNERAIQILKDYAVDN